MLTLQGVHAEKVPSGIGRKDLPGYIDNSGTAHVSKRESSNLWLILAGLMLVNKNRINLL